MESTFDNEVETLKEYARKRITLDMIGDVKQQIGKGTPLILIVDDYTSKLISSLFNMTDLLAEGIFSIEKININRQKFSKYHGLYFISPNKVSLNYIVNDFKDKLPQYKQISIFISSKINDDLLEIVINKEIVKRIKICKELNFSFIAKDESLYDFGINNFLNVFGYKNQTQKRNNYLQEIAEKLFTVATILREYPYIQYQKNSSLCKYIGENLNILLEDFYKTKTYNENRGIILLTDRTLDVTSPLLHDYNYRPIIYDIFNVKGENVEINGKHYKLNENDDLWKKYKNKHISIVFEEMQKDMNEFSKASKNRKNLDSFEEMQEALHNSKSQKAKTDQFTLHFALAEEIADVK